MLLRIPNALKNSGTCTKSIIFSSLRRFSQQDLNSKITIDRNLLYPFSQSLTSKALNTLRETSPSPSNIFLIDKLTVTDYSETYRAYDFDNKTFVAQKNVHLDSPASWNQVNLILRQQQQLSPLFARTLSIDYNEKAQNVKIISELQNTILKDYSLFMKDHQSNWLKERIRFYAMQISQQLDTLKQLGVELEGKSIDPQKIFIEKTTEQLRLYDLSDFTVNDVATSQIGQKELLEIAKKTLIKVIDMRGEEISLVFQEIEAEIKQKDALTEPIQNFMKNSESSIDNSYNKFILDKILQTAITKDSGLHLNISEENKNITHSEIGRDLRDVYIKHADAYSSKGDFKSAIECYEKAMEAEANLVKIQGRVKSDISVSDESIFAITKPKSGLEMVKNFGIEVIFMVFEIFFMLFGAILGLILFVGAVGLFAWGSSQLFGENYSKNDESTGVDEKEK